MGYNPDSSEFTNAYRSFKSGFQETQGVIQVFSLVPTLFGAALFLFCMPGEMLALLTRVRIGSRAFRIQVLAVVFLTAMVYMLSELPAGADLLVEGWGVSGLIGFGWLLLAVFPVRLVMMAVRSARGAAVHSEDAGDALPFFYAVSTREGVVRQLLEPLFYGTISLIVGQFDPLLGLFLAWATLGQLIESTRMLDLLRREERAIRDAAMRAGHTGEIPDPRRERAYEARRATVVTAVWFVAAAVRGWRWGRERWRERRDGSEDRH